MKLRYIIPAFVWLLAMLVGCEASKYDFQLSNVQLSNTYVIIPTDGGEQTITVKANQAWSIDTAKTKSWMEVSPIKGEAGETKVTFKASKSLDGHQADLKLTCGDQVQNFRVQQGLPMAKLATCKEINTGVDGKTYKVTGIVGTIENDLYGNYWISDATGKVYIYGTLNKKGEIKKFKETGIEAGDEITITGPRGIHKGQPQLVGVSVIKVNKSLVKIDSVKHNLLPKEGGECITYVTCKGQGVSVDIPKEAKEWLSISSIRSKGKNVVIVFKAVANTGSADRKANITIYTSDGKKDYQSSTTLTEKGAVTPVSIGEFLAAKVSDSQYRVAGIISKIVKGKYTNLYIKDAFGEVYVFGLKDIEKKGYKEGDILVLVGKRAEYKGKAQIAKVTVEQHIAPIKITISELLKKHDDKDTFFKLTGKVLKIEKEEYGNMTIQDETGKIYIYGCSPYFGAFGDARKGLIKKVGLKEGSTITVIGYKGSHKGAPQLSGRVYVSHQ